MFSQVSKVWISLSFIYILNFTPSYVDLLKQALVFVCQLLQNEQFFLNVWTAKILVE